MRAVGSKIGANSYSFSNDAALREAVKVSVCVTLHLRVLCWAMSLLNILEELSCVLDGDGSCAYVACCFFSVRSKHVK